MRSIFWLLRAYLRLETRNLKQKDVRVEIIGRRDRLTKPALREIERTEQATAEGRRLHLRVAVDYSARAAIAEAAIRVTAGLSRDGLASTDLVAATITDELTGESGDVDLLIRTGGEQRLSDFLLWECSYAELLFADRLWPDFSAVNLDRALEEFQCRERRFGGVPTPIEDSATLLIGCGR